MQLNPTSSGKLIIILEVVLLSINSTFPSNSFTKSCTKDNPILSSLLLIVNIFGFGFSYADIVIQNISKLKLLYRRHIHA